MITSYDHQKSECYTPPKIAIFRMMMFILKMNFWERECWRAWSLFLLHSIGEWVKVVFLFGAIFGVVVIVAPVVLLPEQFVSEIVTSPGSWLSIFQRYQAFYLHDMPLGAVVVAPLITALKTLFNYYERAERLLISMATQAEPFKGQFHE